VKVRKGRKGRKRESEGEMKEGGQKIETVGMFVCMHVCESVSERENQRLHLATENDESSPVRIRPGHNITSSCDP
jgi:hypothetical protein